MWVPSKAAPNGEPPTATVVVSLLEAGSIFDTVPDAELTTQTLVPSKSAAYGLLPTPIVASAAFVAFLSSLTNIRFTAMQYAIFTSVMTLLPKILGGYSGSMVNAMGYPAFFALTAALGIPVVILIVVIARDNRFHWDFGLAEESPRRG